MKLSKARRVAGFIKVIKKDDVTYPRSYRDYNAEIYLDKLPNGVQIGFKSDAFAPVTWDDLPSDEDWFSHG